MTVRTLAANSPRRGVTLVEIMVVVVIIGILSGLAVPKFIAISGQSQLDGDAQTLFMDLAWAKTAAVHSNAPYLVEFKDTTIGSQTRTRWVVVDSATKTVRRKGITGTSVRFGLPSGINPATSSALFSGLATTATNGIQAGLKIENTSDPCTNGSTSTTESWSDSLKTCGGATGNMETGALYLYTTRSSAQAYAIMYNRSKSLALKRFRYIGGTWEAM